MACEPLCARRGGAARQGCTTGATRSCAPAMSSTGILGPDYMKFTLRYTSPLPRDAGEAVGEVGLTHKQKQNRRRRLMQEARRKPFPEN